MRWILALVAAAVAYWFMQAHCAPWFNNGANIGGVVIPIALIVLIIIVVLVLYLKK